MRIDENQEPELIGDFMGDVLDTFEAVVSHQRWEVVRTGDREPIARHVRAAVWYRDHGRCSECLIEGAEILHLDHIVPWSAGGSDASENLRILCERHNMERSNFVDYAAKRRPVTWWCHRCYSEEHSWSYFKGGFVSCPKHGNYDQYCRVARAYRRDFDQGISSNWHQRSPLTSFTHTAYCAHCDAPGLTSVVL